MTTETNFVPISTVLDQVSSTIPAEYWNEAEAIEWAAIAMGKIRAFVPQEVAVVYRHVQDHKTYVPKGLRKIYQIAYRLEEPELTDEDVVNLQEDLHVSERYVFNLLNANWMSTGFFNGYRPLRLSPSPFANAITCENCGVLNAQTEHNFTVSPNGCITTSFREGWICIAYTRYPKNSDGEFLVPQDEDYLDAMRAYIMYRHWEQRWNTKEEGSDARLQFYMQKWNHMQKKAKGNMNLPGIDDLENMRQTRNRLLPKETHYYNFFGMMSQQPQLHMGGLQQEFVIGRAYNNFA